MNPGSTACMVFIVVSISGVACKQANSAVQLVISKLGHFMVRISNPTPQLRLRSHVRQERTKLKVHLRDHEKSQEYAGVEEILIPCRVPDEATLSVFIKIGLFSEP